METAVPREHPRTEPGERSDVSAVCRRLPWCFPPTSLTPLQEGHQRGKKLGVKRQVAETLSSKTTWLEGRPCTVFSHRNDMLAWLSSIIMNYILP